MSYPLGRPPTAPWVEGLEGTPPPPPPTRTTMRALAVKPWTEEPPPTAVNFFIQETTNLILPAGVGAVIESASLTGGAIQMPPNNYGVIKAVQWFAQAPTNLTSIVYTVRANRLGLRGLANLKFPPQNAGAVNFTIGGTWTLPQAAYLDFVVTNLNINGPWEVNLTMTGWYDSAAAIYDWTGQQPGQTG